MKKTIADEEKLETCANYLINERGYLVVGLVLWHSYEIGQIIKVLWNAEIKQPLRVIARTDSADWLEQRRVASQHFDEAFKKNFYLQRDSLDEQNLSNYYRVITD